MDTETETMTVAEADLPDDDDFVVCDSGDGWSLHMPGADDDDIASGDEAYLVAGAGDGPTDDDYRAARAAWIVRTRL